MGAFSIARALAGPVLLAVVSAAALPAPAQTQPGSELDEVLRRTLEAGRARGEIEIGSDLAFASEALPRFYEERGFEPAWTAPDGPLPEARTLVRLLQEAELDGLRGSDYHLARITALLGGRRGPVTEELDHLELALSDAALVYAAHLAAGKTDPAALHPQWRASRNDLDAARFLADALDGGDLRAAYEGLRPPYPDYRRLRQGLADLRRIAAAGGWGAVPPGEALRPGDASERIPALRARLAASGDLPPTRVPPADPVYDPDLEAAVHFFQSRHGLTADGLEALIASGAQQTVRLPEPVPIHVQYSTAWADGQGALHLRDDVYDRDGAVLRALDEAPPG